MDKPPMQNRGCPGWERFAFGLYSFKRSIPGCPGWKRSTIGFTLAELLIALAILGLIAVFTVPKVIAAQQAAKRDAIFKETVTTLSGLLYAGMQEGSIYQNGTAADVGYILAHVNAVRICPSDPGDTGCWDNSKGTLGYAHSSCNGGCAGFVLPNGAVVAGNGLVTRDPYNSGIVIDYKGTDPPNAVGEDQMGIRFCLDKVNPCTFWNETVKPMSIGPSNFTHPNNEDSAPLWYSVWD